MPGILEFTVEEGDIRTFDADVVALKYAQAFFQTDGMIAAALAEAGVKTSDLQPEEGKHAYVSSRGAIRARHVLYAGAPPLGGFGYAAIRELSSGVLGFLAERAPETRHIAMTLHGAGFGLDEVEALQAQFAGYVDAIQAGRVPPALEKISLVEISASRVARLRRALDESLSGLYWTRKLQPGWAYQLMAPQVLRGNAGSSSGSILDAGVHSEEKPHVFVAMPFRQEFEDLFEFGVQEPVRSLGFLCESVKDEAFVGDILGHVKGKIETAAAVVAVLTDANPNVFLELGYAWGKNRPTILAAREPDSLPFDVRGQRCLKYGTIGQLRKLLAEELRGLLARGRVAAG
jgi:hypothetical protein